MKKQTFYIMNNKAGGKGFEPVEGYYGKDERGIEFFTHRSPGGHYWIGTELHTGLSITSTKDTRNEAIVEANDRLRTARENGFKTNDVIAEAIKTNGHSPYCA